jgi:hypothetical protein
MYLNQQELNPTFTHYKVKFVFLELFVVLVLQKLFSSGLRLHYLLCPSNFSFFT